jgi:translocation and assembly module TamB
MNAPLFAQLRYVGPADTLWRLTGTEIIDLSGPLAVGADIGGRLSNPVIRGSVKTQNARLESAVTGMVIEQLQSDARFSGPQLIFNQIVGKTPGGSPTAMSDSISRSTRPRLCSSTATTSLRA